MTTQEVTVDATPNRKRKRLTVGIVASVLVIGGGIAAVIGVNAYSAETERLCDAALEKAETAHTAARAEIEAADDALTAVESTKLPDGGTSTSYSERPAAETTDNTDARPSGAELIEETTSRRDALTEAKDPEQCSDRDQAERITSSSKKTESDTDSLEKAVTKLLTDFEQFQTEETARIAAEKQAAQKAAAEAQRVAAEEAARQAEQSYSGDDYTDSGYSGGGGGGGGTMIPPPPGQSGGGCPPGMAQSPNGEGCYVVP